ncbi:MAG TPA: hypothetical protein VN684_11345 [Terriglobales bacterium]|nr:hypothetical protein [Terriglobales bacterium]
MKPSDISRRNFLQVTALSIGALAPGSKALAQVVGGHTISLVADPNDPICAATPSLWALQELTRAFNQHDIAVQRYASVDQAPASDLCIVAAGSASGFATPALRKANVSVSSQAESLGLVPFTRKGKPALLACGSDSRGLMYALLELADRVRYSENPLLALRVPWPITEQPFNQVRSIGKLFSSDVEDKPWFNDREMWPAYFAMLAANRINRFNFSVGIGYDTLEYVTDSYFLFAYPFLLRVPGYDVRAVNLPDEERDHNLEMLQYISHQAVAHGIDFQLGIWTHGYIWEKTPHSNYTIEGITPENHAAYSSDALAALLKACPDISGVTLRTHGESGVREGSYGFWKTVFDGVPKSGRKVEIDLHTKGLNQTILDSALATGMPVKLSPKYWAEHMGLPYQQTAIRDLEMPKEDRTGQSFYSLSTGSRIFTRYGYADFLKEDRPYTLIYRIWPGTHRFLLWGDPASNAAHARAFNFCSSNGVELYEPLSFRGRRGSGLPGNRGACAENALVPQYDWEKYLYTYRTWGRLLYNPDAETDVWQRQLRTEFKSAAGAVESALGAATQIVPLVTTTHLPSAANDTYGPEFYTNQSIMDASKYSPYGDTPAPKVFGNVSPLDPQMFYRINDFAADILKNERSGKYSPIEVAQWLEDLSSTASSQLSEAAISAVNSTPVFRRMAADVKIHAGLGRFFAAKFRSGVLYAIYQQSGDRTALEEAVKLYRQSRDIWAQFAGDSVRVYTSDISFGPRAYERGHWLDRLAAMDDDIASMAQLLKSSPNSASFSPQVRAAVEEAVGHPTQRSIACVHTSPSQFVPGKELELALSLKHSNKFSARLYYRHVNQAEHYQSLELQHRSDKFHGAIPASYTQSQYPLQYYFELKQGQEKAWLYPGLEAKLMNQPYFVVRSVRA